MHRSWVFAALFVPALALASDGATQFTDRGPALKVDPYLNGSELSTGRLEGFRWVYVPPAFADDLRPAKAASVAAKGTLPLVNPTSAYMDVKIGGAVVGRVEPFHEALIHDVPAGVYAVDLELPNGYRWSAEISTRVAEPAPANNG